MRLVLISLAASLVAATPALANEARVEARGGVIWGGGDSEAIAGVAAGYDYDLGDTAFVGAEVTADKILTDGTKVTFGFNGRVGAKIAEAGKLYAVGGYNTESCDLCDGTWTAGAGYQHSFGKLYGKVEYRHFFVKNGFSDADAVVAGLGMKF
jgi:outer membrane immunogenic protein